MKQTLVIGSTVVDLFLSIPNLPQRGEDVNISAVEYRIGGCAYTVYKTMQLFHCPALLCSPVGSGIYGAMVMEQFRREGISPIVRLEEENGCCYCLVDKDGERTFLSHHGAEYRFSRDWIKGMDLSEKDGVFICGIELEDSDGNEIAGFVCETPELELYFAPGPRILQIPADRMERLLCRRNKADRGPLLHLNEREALSFSGKSVVEEGAEFLAGKTDNAVIITLGERGCYCLEKPGYKGHFIPGFPSRVIDTVGAGDAHCGAVIACLKEGLSLEEACLRANRIGAKVVSIRGAVLDELPQ